jgi:hypothetical protein
MKMRIALALLASLLSQTSLAQTPSLYSLTDSAGNKFNVAVYTCPTSKICPISVSSDSSGNALSGPIGTTNANGTALYVQGVTGGVPLTTTISGTLPAFASAPTVNLGTIGGAATQTTLAAIQTALGSPLQAGGTVSATQSGNWTMRNVGATGATLDFAGQNATGTINAFLVGGQFNTAPTTITTGNFSPFQLDANGNLLVNVKAGGGAGGTSSSFAAAFPATGTAVGMTQGGNMVALSGTAGNLNVQCANCSGSGVSTADEAAFVGGTSLFAGGGGFFQTTATNNALTTGQQGMFQVTANRALFANLRNAAGTEIGTSGTPIQVSVANTAANGTAMLVTGTGGTFPITAASLPLPTGAATSANQQTNAAIASTTAGQTGTLSMGAVTTAAPTYTTSQTNPLSLTTAGALRVDGSSVTQPVSLTSTTITGTVAVTQSGAWTVNPTTAANWGIGATAAAVPANAVYVGMTQSGNLTGLTGTSGNLNVQCANCSGSGVSTADEAAFTGGTSLFAGGGGFFQTTATSNALTTGQQGMFQVTANRALFSNLRNAAGTEVGTAATPLQVSLANTGANATPLASNITQVLGAAISATNGLFSNILQGNAALSATNGIFVNILQGNAVLSSGNPAFVSVTNANNNGVAPAGNSSPVIQAFSGSTTLQTAAVANGNGTNMVINGYGGAVLHVVCSVACSGGTTINFEVSFDGTTYLAIQGTPIGGGAPTSTATTTGDFGFNIAGYTDLRARISNYSAGTITVTGFSSSPSALQPAVIATNNLTQINGVALGSPSAYGTSPGTVNVMGVNAFITNTVPVTLTSTTITGTVAVVGPTAVGSANANPPIVIGGTATGAAGANVQGMSIVATSTAPATATNTAVVVDLRPDSPGIIALGTNTPANSVPVVLSTTPTIANGSGVVGAPSSEALAALTPIVSAALESNHVIKASAGNFYSGYVTTGAVSGWLLLANSTTAPTAGGAAIAPLACVPAAANATTSIGTNIPMRFSTGITMVFSTSGCLTNTASATAFFSGMAN